MLQLVLFRHARAEKFSASDNDFDRDATPAGREEARKVARALAEAGAAPGMALVSPAKRCTATWDEVASLFANTEARPCPELYLAGEREILALASAAGPDSVMVIGHNPGLKSLAQTLPVPMTDDRNFRFPPATAALLERESVDSAWTIEGLFLP